VPRGPGFDAIVERVADASLALYEELLELVPDSAEGGVWHRFRFGPSA
jgi:hypothetical protein